MSVADRERDPVAWAEQFQAAQVEYIMRGDVDGLVDKFYTQDARIEAFDVRAVGRPALKEVVRLYLKRLADFGPPTVERFAAGPGYIWIEVDIPPLPSLAPRVGEGREGGGAKTYEIKLLRDDRIAVQFFGFRRGTVWRPGDFAGWDKPQPGDAMRLHDDYVGYHARGDADGLVDDLFTEDGRAVTRRATAEGREALRKFYRGIFAAETGFTMKGVEKIARGPDYVWFEAGVVSSLGARRLYDIMTLREGKISQLFVGLLEGAMPDEVAAGRTAGPGHQERGGGNDMTPEQNNAIAVRFFESVWDKGDFAVLDELVAPDAVDHSTVGGKEKTEPGSGSFRQIVSMFRHAMPDIKLTIHDEIYAKDRVVHRWSLTGTDTGGVMGMPPSKKKLTFGGTTTVRMRDGKIVERWTNVDELGLLQQLGVVPPPPGAK